MKKTIDVEISHEDILREVSVDDAIQVLIYATTHEEPTKEQQLKLEILAMRHETEDLIEELIRRKKEDELFEDEEKKLADTFYQLDPDRSVWEVCQYLGHCYEEFPVKVEDLQALSIAMKDIRDPKAMSQIANESWSKADLSLFIKEMLVGERTYLYSKEQLVEEFRNLLEMA